MPPRSRATVDTFSVAEAARVLALSEKRVRQLKDDGRLEVASEPPLRLSQTSVIAMRDERRANGLQGERAGGPSRTAKRPSGPTVDADTIREWMAAAVDTIMPRAIESAEAAARRTEEVLKAENDRLREENASLRQALEEAKNRRGIFRRTP